MKDPVLYGGRRNVLLLYTWNIITITKLYSGVGTEKGREVKIIAEVSSL